MAILKLNWPPDEKHKFTYEIADNEKLQQEGYIGIKYEKDHNRDDIDR